MKEGGVGNGERQHGNEKRFFRTVLRQAQLPGSPPEFLVVEKAADAPVFADPPLYCAGVLL